MVRIRSTVSAASFGQWIGEALAEGIAEGAQGAIDGLGRELAPIVQEIVAGLRQEMIASLAAAAPVEEIYDTGVLKLCQEPGCSDAALARNLCRRHYARKLYQERKARLGGNAALAPRPRARPETGGDRLMEKKLAAVAPIIRRRKSDAPAPIEAPQVQVALAANGPALVTPLPGNATPPPSVSESVAKFFGMTKG